MKLWGFCFRLAGIAALALCLSWGLSNLACAQDKVTVTFWWLPEQAACCPDGYKSYDSDQLSNCRQLTPKDFEMWEDKEFTREKRDIAAKEEIILISLGDQILTLLAAYGSPVGKTPRNRRVIAMVFHWDETQNGPISLARACVGEDGEPIPARKWSGAMNRENNWISHCRADAFLPANNVKWTLKVGDKKWVFKTQ